jgi:hypothetical protein
VGQFDAAGTNFTLSNLDVTDLSLLRQRFRAFLATQRRHDRPTYNFRVSLLRCCACKTGSLTNPVNRLHPHKDTFFSES